MEENQAYLNIGQYGKQFLIGYFLNKNGRQGKTKGFTNSSSLRETKEKLGELVKGSLEEEINIISENRLKKDGYIKIGLEKLKELQKFLSSKRKDITFLL